MSLDLRAQLADALDTVEAKERRIQELLGFIRQQHETIVRLTGLVDEARLRIESDEDKLVGALEEVILKARSRLWVVDGRGSYEWDDDEYRREAGYALNEVIEVARKGIFLSHQLCLDFWKPLNATVEAARAQEHKVPEESTDLLGDYWELHDAV